MSHMAGTFNNLALITLGSHRPVWLDYIKDIVLLLDSKPCVGQSGTGAVF
jgi:hypothetical protein